MIDKVATGSTAEIKAPKRRGSMGFDVSMRANPYVAEEALEIQYFSRKNPSLGGLVYETKTKQVSKQ